MVAIIALMGLPGSGKSTLARTVMEHHRLHVIDRDTIRAALFPRCGFSDAEKRAANRAVMEALEANLKLGRSCLIDGMTFADAELRAALTDKVSGSGATLRWVYMNCELEEAARRVRDDLRQGRHAAGDRSPELVAEVAERFAEVPAAALKLDALKTAHELLQELEQWLGDELKTPEDAKPAPRTPPMDDGSDDVDDDVDVGDGGLSAMQD